MPHDDGLPFDTITVRLIEQDCVVMNPNWVRIFRKAVQRRVDRAMYGATATIHNVKFDEGLVDIKIIHEGAFIDGRNPMWSRWRFEPIDTTVRPEPCKIRMDRLSRSIKGA